MSTAAVFCIRTGHDHFEDANVLVKLWRACSFADLGVAGNHTGDGIPGRSGDRIADPTGATPGNGGWKWINEGQNSIGGGMKSQTAANVKHIMALRPDHVVLVGHSRGAILCLRIAAKLQAQLGTYSPQCFLFLYDPVKRLRQGTDKYNRTVHANVRKRLIVAIEDEGGKKAGVKKFKLAVSGRAVVPRPPSFAGGLHGSTVADHTGGLFHLTQMHGGSDERPARARHRGFAKKGIDRRQAAPPLPGRDYVAGRQHPARRCRYFTLKPPQKSTSRRP